MTRFKEASFKLPEQLSSDFGREAYSAEAVKEWINTLPIINRGESIHKVFVFLNVINNLDLAAEDRYEILQLLCPIINDFINAIQTKMSGKSFPLSDIDTKIAELCSELVSKMVIGYELVLRAGQKKNWLAREARKGIWLAALYRLLFYFHAILCGYQLINRSAPKGLWRHTHSLYMRTHELNWHDSTIAKEVTHGEPTTLENTYKELLLLSLMSRHQFQPLQFAEVQSLIGFFAGLMHVRPARASEKNMLLFCISPSHDTPPLALQCRDHREYPGDKMELVLDTRGLGDYLSRIIHGNKPVVSLDGHPLHRDTAELLYETWCHPHARSETRVAGGGRLKLSLGFSNTHRIILALAQTEIANNGSEEGVTYIDYATPNITNPIWQVSSRKVATHTFEAAVVNHSTNGVCLQFTPKVFGSIRHGDVLGLQREGKRAWDLARVCWLKSEEEGQLVLGAEKIINDIVPVELTVRHKNNEHSDPLPALLGLNRSVNLVVVMPFIPGAMEKQYEMSYMGHRIPVDLEKPYISTPSFHAFNIAEDELIHQFQEREGKEAEGEEKLEKTGIETEEYRAGYVEEDEYADIWNKL